MRVTRSPAIRHPNVNAPLLSESLYVTATWVARSVLPMPNGFDPTSGLTCADSSDCSAGGTLNESSVFITTTDSGHRWTILPLTVKSGYQLFELSCSSEDDCQGVMGPSWAAQYESPKGGWLTQRPPHELFVTTSDAGRTWASTPLQPSHWVTTFACSDTSHCVVMGISKVAYEAVSKQQLDEYPAVTRNKIPKRYLGPVGYFVESTKDDGATWSTGTLPQAAGPSDLSCVSSSDCAALDLVTIPNPSPCPANGASPPAGSVVLWSDRCGVGRHHHERWWSDVASSNVSREHSAANHVRAVLPLEQRLLGHWIRSGSPDHRETSRRRFFGDPPDDRRRPHVVQDHFRGTSWGAESVRAIVHEYRFH